MSRWARSHGKPDQNNQDIADKARSCGASVTITTGVGRGFVDQVWGFGRDDSRGIPGITLLVEVKRRGKKLEPHQADFARDWRGGPVVTVQTADDVVAVLQGPLVRRLMREQAVLCGCAEDHDRMEWPADRACGPAGLPSNPRLV